MWSILATMSKSSEPQRWQHAAVLHAAGDLRLESRTVRSPGSQEALIRVAAVGICGSDVAYLNGTAKYDVNGPLIMGHEAAGVIDAVGPGSGPEARLGDRVAISPSFSCGKCSLCVSGRENLCPEVRYLGSAATSPHIDGALQQFLVVPVANLLPLPASVSWKAAALLEPLAVAYHAVQRADVADRSVLITGGGAIGQLLSLAARALGAGSITMSECVSERRDAAVAHGADRALDSGDARRAVELGERFDVIFDASGHPAAVDLALCAVEPAVGRVVLVGNLPPSHKLPVHEITRVESWVTATFRFPGGLGPALGLLVDNNLDVEWLVEHSTDLYHVRDAFAAAQRSQAPLKVQVTTPAPQAGARPPPPWTSEPPPTPSPEGSQSH